MYLIKGVSLAGVQPAIVLAMLVLDKIFDAHDQNMYVTSVLDGIHMRASLHYVGAAFDVGLPKRNTLEIVADAHEMLGENYDVVVEGDHIHVEFQPKIGA